MKDPLQGGPEAEKVLFEAMGKVAKGYSIEAVLGASVNMICNCIRQTHGLRSQAEARMKELYGVNMEILMKHYDPTTGRRRSVIKFDQVIHMPHFHDTDKF